MKVDMRLASGAGAFLKEIADNIRLIYAEKGMEPFKKPLLFSVPALLILYNAAYAPLHDKLRFRSSELTNRQLIAEHYSEYQDAKDRIAAYQRRLPLLKDKEDWLNYLLTSTARTCGIVIDNLSSQTESEIGNFLLVSRSVTVTTNYAALGRWIAEIEKSPITLKVTEADIKKEATAVGAVKVTLKLSTIFSKLGKPEKEK